MCPASGVSQCSRWPEPYPLPPGCTIRIIIIKSSPYSRMRRRMTCIDGVVRSSRRLHNNMKLSIENYITIHNNLYCLTIIVSRS